MQLTKTVHSPENILAQSTRKYTNKIKYLFIKFYSMKNGLIYVREVNNTSNVDKKLLYNHDHSPASW